jgi:transglutaminase-like putative cysteine protease
VNPLRRPSLFIALLLLQTVALSAVVHGMSPHTSSLYQTSIVVLLAFLALMGGRSQTAGRGQIARIFGVLIFAVALVFFLEDWLTGPRSMATYPAIFLMAGHNLLLATRRDLYFNLALLLVIFMGVVDTLQGVAVWLIGIPFVTALVALMIADYVDRRLALANDAAYLPSSEHRFDASNIAFVTATALVLATAIYLVLPRFPSPLIGAINNEFIPAGSKSGDAPWTAGAGEMKESLLSGGGHLKAHAGATAGGNVRRKFGGNNMRFDLAMDREIDQGNAEAKGGEGDSTGDLQKSQASQGSESGGNGQSGTNGNGSAQPDERPNNSANASSTPSQTEGESSSRQTSPPPSYARPLGEPKRLFNVATGQPLLMRVRVYDRFDGRSWYSSAAGYATLPGAGRFQVSPKSHADLVGQAVKLETNLDDAIPAALQPEYLEFATSNIVVSDDAVMYSPTAMGSGTAYFVASSVYYRGKRPGGTWQELKNADANLDTSSASGKVLGAAWQIVAGLHTPIEKAEALEQYLRTNFQRRETPAGTLSPSMEQFMFETHAGPASMFASSLAMMLRVNGIPARFVTGFRVRRPNPFTDRYDVYDYDAHAWVEAYVEGHWMIYEATPRVQLPIEGQSMTPLGAFRQYAEANLEDLQRQMQTQEPNRPTSTVQKLTNNALLGLMGLLAWLMTYGHWLLVAMALVFWLFKKFLPHLVNWMGDTIDLLRVWHHRNDDACKLVLYVHAMMERAFTRRKLARPVTVNHSEYGDYLVSKTPHLAWNISVLGQMFAMARYGNHNLAKADAALARRAYREILQLIDEPMPK